MKNIELRVKKKLSYFNLKNEPEQLDNLINDIVEDTVQDILNYCNLDKLPKELEHIAIFRSLGQVISHLYCVGQLYMKDVELTRTLSSITRGDVSMTYKSNGATENLEEYFEYLKNYAEKDLCKFRRIVW